MLHIVKQYYNVSISMTATCLPVLTPRNPMGAFDEIVEGVKSQCACVNGASR